MGPVRELRLTAAIPIMKPYILTALISAAVARPVTADVTIFLQSQTFAGFQFNPAVNYAVAPIVGTLTGASIDVVLNSSVSYTYADDLCIYVDVEVLSTGGKLQIGGFSNLSAAQRYRWPNGNSSAPGTTSVGSVSLATPLHFYGSPTVDGRVWVGNGYGASGTRGTWTGTITLHGVCWAECGPDGDGDFFPDSIDNCPLVRNPTQADCDEDGIGDACQPGDDFNGDGIPDYCECIADIFTDGRVDGGDLGGLLAQWGPTTPTTRSDLNNDGVVNGADLGYLLSNWGPCPN